MDALTRERYPFPLAALEREARMRPRPLHPATRSVYVPPVDDWVQIQQRRAVLLEMDRRLVKIAKDNLLIAAIRRWSDGA